MKIYLITTVLMVLVSLILFILSDVVFDHVSMKKGTILGHIAIGLLALVAVSFCIFVMVIIMSVL